MPRVDAVRGQGAFEPSDGDSHAPQGVAGHVGIHVFRNQVFEEAGHQVLHAEGQPQGVELGLGVVAVHGRDAGGDVPLLVDVLHRGGRGGAEDYRLQLFEHGKGHVEQSVAVGGAGVGLPRGHGAGELQPGLGLELQVVAHAGPTLSADREYFWASSWWVRIMRVTRRGPQGRCCRVRGSLPSGFQSGGGQAHEAVEERLYLGRRRPLWRRPRGAPVAAIAAVIPAAEAPLSASPPSPSAVHSPRSTSCGFSAHSRSRRTASRVLADR